MSTEAVTSEFTEAAIRRMRDTIYGPCTDKNWEACKHNWFRADSIEWLIKELNKLGFYHMKL